MATGLMILTSLHVALSAVAIVTGLRLLLDMMRGLPSSDVIPIYFATSVVVCTTSSQLPITAPAASGMVGLICLLSVLTAMHARYLGRMRDTYQTIYAVATSISVFTVGVGATLQGIAALPELKSLAPLLARKSVALVLTALSFGMTALAVRGVRKTGGLDLWVKAPE